MNQSQACSLCSFLTGNSLTGNSFLLSNIFCAKQTNVFLEGGILYLNSFQVIIKLLRRQIIDCINLGHSKKVGIKGAKKSWSYTVLVVVLTVQ